MSDWMHKEAVVDVDALCWVCRKISADVQTQMFRVTLRNGVKLHLCMMCVVHAEFRPHPFILHECFCYHDDEGCVGFHGKACLGGGPRRPGWRWVLKEEYLEGLRQVDRAYAGHPDHHSREQEFLRQAHQRRGVVKVDYKGDVI
jgi:hypothetical protein